LTTAWLYYTGKGSANQPTVFANRGGLFLSVLQMEKEEISHPPNGVGGCYFTNIFCPVADDFSKETREHYAKENLHTHHLGF
jgi:hypothetical protein